MYIHEDAMFGKRGMLAISTSNEDATRIMSWSQRPCFGGSGEPESLVVEHRRWLLR